ncbi:CvpA family protein [Anaerobacillus sp. CMMVII]|uniref:CvpA family protein n=1 Tax=Anaerobacillus sp. CMMVII TaxID=2755588 RepID=UPI0021B8356F|nr:CvpA family protein [Anaerobacillus sp. CMMVII]MCT8137438.1 CvpA family protein [Anaerobacillus sp. CMMVII]
MLSLLLLILLITGFLVGFRRGFILQLIHLTGFIVAFFVAYKYSGDLAKHIRLWIPYPQFPPDSTAFMVIEAFNFEHVYYSGIAFAILFFATKIAMQIIGSMFDFLAHLPILNIINGWLGGVLCFLETLLILVVILHIAALLPIELVQDLLKDSSLAKLILDYTPILSNQIKDLWIENRF